MKQTRVVMHFTGDISYQVPEKLVDLIAFYEEQLSRIPEECADSATVKYDITDEYGCLRTDIDIVYKRQETDAEKSIREARERVDSERSEAEKMKQYEKLKKELGL